MNDEQIWTTTLDRRYTVTVNRVAFYRGELIITEAGKVLHRESVGLMYGAQFGPDVSDVALWKEMAINLVDSLKRIETLSYTPDGRKRAVNCVDASK